MKVSIVAMGRQKASPEAALVEDYLNRFDRTGRALGLGPARLVELDDRKGGGKAGEGALITKALAGVPYVALDERGAVMSSPAFATLLATRRDQGGDLAFVIGGADGLDGAVTGGAVSLLSFGKMVWPHMLARVMLAEQLYRAATILAGGPYHRA